MSKNLSNKTILVTGSAGFIGSHVSNYLLTRGVNVIGLDNLNSYYDVSLKQARNKRLLEHKNYIFYEGDLSNRDLLNKIFTDNKIHKICNLAAQVGVRYSLENPYVYEESNVKGFLNILECARNYPVENLVYASSSSVYGATKMPKNGFSETQVVDTPISLYAVTKKANELMAYTYNHLYGINTTGLRFFTVYGPWGRPDMAYFKFTKAILSGNTIDVYNHGKMKRDFTYVDDVVAGVVNALDKSYPCEVFNIGNSNTVDLQYFIKCIENSVGKKAKINLLPLQPGDVLETFADISHAVDKLNFKPQVAIEEGIDRFVQWYREFYK